MSTSPSSYPQVTLTACKWHPAYAIIHTYDQALVFATLILGDARQYGEQSELASRLAKAHPPFSAQWCCPAQLYARHLMFAALRALTQGE